MFDDSPLGDSPTTLIPAYLAGLLIGTPSSLITTSSNFTAA